MLPLPRTRLVLLAVACSLSAASFAQGLEHREHPGLRREPEVMRPHPLPAHLDPRYGHDHYYPAHGTVVPVVPAGAVSVAVGADRWYFHGGVWFRPAGPSFIVAMPPVGIVVPVLPPACVTLRIGGAAYFYANDVYYAAAPGGYVVVAPPADLQTAQWAPPPAPAPAPAPAPVVYPRNGQTVAQTETDRQECNRWATAQPGATTDSSIFQRATAACLDGRGYTVR